jgi:prevent-host-death family protein
MGRTLVVHVGSRALKLRLGSYLRQVRGGTRLVVTDRGRPVAELRPIPEASGLLEERLARAAERGVLTLPSREFASLPEWRPLVRPNAGLSRAVAEEREERI